VTTYQEDKMEIKNIEIKELESWENQYGSWNNGGLQISWSANIGFGKLDIVIGKNNKIFIDTESLGKEFAKQILCQMIDEAEEIG
jgi:hypothetical protein